MKHAIHEGGCDCTPMGLSGVINAHLTNKGRKSDMYDGGVFGGYTRWAVVFLIIFVLFFLLIPSGFVRTCTTTPVC
ncbi:hypothetical protein [Alicyclobacillus shizuokensis]|uniref:hypothetical protein n=1 Tax=Alicyclobacillus shizuokensis TaxID=392014 RepID=UPI0012EE42E9|nr:hypothetical protein [Alicyclobacillus shizuokensis]MCL6625685.1 hypothetical protein [Alicyclobacillus shizuokensis]